ncbi:MAG: DUF222 domain-containing protein [Acidimicrobiia bacterium]|nr:DUF222 domain-containing protein [Acidimicrobiia bacterium]
MGIGGVTEPGGELAALEAAVDACFDTPLSCLDAQETSDRLVALVRITAKIDSLRMDTVHAADRVEVGHLSDQRNTANHVAGRTLCDPGSVRFDERIISWLVDLPVLAAAFRAGEITIAHVEKLRLADNHRVHQQLVESQELFVSMFTTCQFRDLDHLITEWLLGADPDGAEPNDREQRFGLSFTPIPGGIKVAGTLNPLQGAALRDEVNAEANKLRAAEKQAGAVSTVRRRTLDALLNLVGRGTARPDGSFARPRVNIVMSQRVYEKTVAWLADPAGNRFPEIDRTDIDKRCQLIDGTPIHPLYAMAASVTATFRRIVYSARGRPIDASFDSRRIPDWMRDITLVSTNGKCANPVCDSPFHWLHADHITPYSHTGDTSVENTRPVCEGDNLWRSNDTTRGTWPARTPNWNEDDIAWPDDYNAAA